MKRKDVSKLHSTDIKVSEYQSVLMHRLLRAEPWAIYAAAVAYGMMICGRHAMQVHDRTACLYAGTPSKKTDKAPFTR